MGLATIDPHSQKRNEKKLQRNVWKCCQIRKSVSQSKVA